MYRVWKNRSHTRSANEAIKVQETKFTSYEEQYDEWRDENFCLSTNTLIIGYFFIWQHCTGCWQRSWPFIQNFFFFIHLKQFSMDEKKTLSLAVSLVDLVDKKRKFCWKFIKIATKTIMDISNNVEKWLQYQVSLQTSWFNWKFTDNFEIREGKNKIKFHSSGVQKTVMMTMKKHRKTCMELYC